MKDIENVKSIIYIFGKHFSLVDVIKMLYTSWTWKKMLRFFN